MQVLHAGQMGARRMALRDETHYQATLDFERRRKAALQATKDERIERFMQQREPELFLNEKLAQAVLRPDICEGGSSQKTTLNAELNPKRRKESYG